jgi:pSer/pThr/pTyr-binding forkhead associated (FHA) protein
VTVPQRRGKSHPTRGLQRDPGSDLAIAVESPLIWVAAHRCAGTYRGEPMRFNLILGGTTIPIGETGAVLGRSVACSVRLDGEGVSRRHARLMVKDNFVLIEDLGSVIGVLVNGELIVGPQRLKGGDIITIGRHELGFSAQHSTRPPAPKGPKPLDSIWEGDENDYGDGAATALDSLILLVGPDVARLLEAGRVDKAERFFEQPFVSTLNAAKRTRDIEPRTNRQAATLALRLARATGRTRWVDSLLELQVAAKTALPVDLLGDLATTVNEVGATNVKALRSCIAMARGGSRKPDDVARKALTRLDKLVSRIAGDGGGDP